MRRVRIGTIHAVLAAIVVLGALSMGGGATAAPKGASCAGPVLDEVYRSDYTGFDSVKECRQYVKAGGTLVRPSIYWVLHVHFGEWCEVSYGPTDFPTSVTVEIVRTAYYNGGTLDMQTRTRYIDPTGQIVDPSSGSVVPYFGSNSTESGYEMTVTATFPGPEGPIVVNGSYYCELR